MEECQCHTEDQHVEWDILIFGKHNLPWLAKLLGERLHKINLGQEWHRSSGKLKILGFMKMEAEWYLWVRDGSSWLLEQWEFVILSLVLHPLLCSWLFCSCSGSLPAPYCLPLLPLYIFSLPLLGELPILILSFPKGKARNSLSQPPLQQGHEHVTQLCQSGAPTQDWFECEGSTGWNLIWQKQSWGRDTWFTGATEMVALQGYSVPTINFLSCSSVQWHSSNGSSVFLAQSFRVIWVMFLVAHSPSPILCISWEWCTAFSVDESKHILLFFAY